MAKNDPANIERKAKNLVKPEEKITARKKKGGKENLTPFAPGASCKRFAVEKQMKAKALYLSKGGNISDEAIGKAVGASRRSVINWRHEQKWEEELSAFQEQFKQDIIDKIRTDGDVSEEEASDDELVGVAQEIVGPAIASHLAQFLARIHKSDLEDLEKLNIAIRHNLTRAAEPGSDGKILPMRSQDINNLVNAKISIIKATRLILGQSTENIKGSGGGGDTEELAVVLELDPVLARSLVMLSTIEITDADYKEIKEPGDGDKVPINNEG